jgi:ferrochelatase
MAYGTAAGPEDIERYYTDIRGGRKPSPQHLQELRGRYAAIGNRFPLLQTTRAQATEVVEELNDGGPIRFSAYLGMKHSPPFIPDAVQAMVADGLHRAIGLVMAPHWSGMSVEGYIDRATHAAADAGGPLRLSFVRSFHDHPGFVELLADRVRGAVDQLPAKKRGGASVVFTAHSLPTRRLPDGTLRCKMCALCESSCRYRDELKHSADLVAERLRLPSYSTAWQSIGRTADPWWGPSVEERMGQLAGEGHSAVVVCSAGFVSDHLETLYDLDIEAKAEADSLGIDFVRTRMPNADPEFIHVLAEVVREHLADLA